MKFTNTILIMAAIYLVTNYSSDDSVYGKDKDEMTVYLWKNRPLILFAPSPDNFAYRSVQNNLSARFDQIVDRHMVIIEIFENGIVRTDGKSDSRLNAESLRRRFLTENGRLEVALIGKDGGLKLRQIGRLNLDEIFSVIDSMPMRQQEMRKSTK